MTSMETFVAIFVVVGLAAAAWATARFGRGYKSKALQYDENSPVPASEEERMKRVSAIVAASVMLVYGLVVIASVAMRG